MDASDAEEFSEVGTKPLKSLPYDTPVQTFVAFEKPEGISAVGKFSNMLRFTVKEVYMFLNWIDCLGNLFVLIMVFKDTTCCRVFSFM